MKTKQMVLKSKDLATATFTDIAEIQPQLGFVFGPTSVFENQDFIKKLVNQKPGVQWVGCSTAGEVSQKGVTDDAIVMTGLHFENPKVKFKIASAKIESAEKSSDAGEKLAKALSAPDLHSLLIISPGVNVNGSLLVKGVLKVVNKNVVVTGGLAGDGAKFSKTYTLSPEGASSDHVVGIGLYGDAVQLKHGCMGGWEPFGKTRKVTKSKANVIFELDNKPALNIYKEYLGDHAKDLPASGLMFPFAILNDQQAETGLIRTILSVDEKAGSLTFAGDVEEGCFVRLMHANTNGLVGGAKGAAEHAILKGIAPTAFAMIVSCVGRKLVMGANVDEEIEAISEVFGKGCSLAGFYSYGEISPFLTEVGCQLHNQTMTISYISEK
ncbi:MAG: FIST signal transduction protein [Bdellovibrionales bacterium]